MNKELKIKIVKWIEDYEKANPKDGDSTSKYVEVPEGTLEGDAYSILSQLVTENEVNQLT